MNLYVQMVLEVLLANMFMLCNELYHAQVSCPSV